MGYMILPLATLLFGIGMQMQFSQMALAVSGAGKAGQMQTLAVVQAQQIELFGAACLNAAIAAPGVVSNSLPVVLASGANTPPQAVCMTTTGTAGSRNVYGYMPGAPGEAGQIISDSGSSAVWYRVQAAGQAINLVNAQALPVPATIPVGAIVDSINVTP